MIHYTEAPEETNMPTPNPYPKTNIYSFLEYFHCQSIPFDTTQNAKYQLDAKNYQVHCHNRNFLLWPQYIAGVENSTTALGPISVSNDMGIAVSFGMVSTFSETLKDIVLAPEPGNKQHCDHGPAAGYDWCHWCWC